MRVSSGKAGEKLRDVLLEMGDRHKSSGGGGGGAGAVNDGPKQAWENETERKTKEKRLSRLDHFIEKKLGEQKEETYVTDLG